MELRFFQVLTDRSWWRRAGPGGVKSDAQVLEQSVQFVLLDESFGSFHLLLTSPEGEFWVHCPGAQDQGFPFDPFARLGLLGRFLDLAFLFGIQVAEGVGEVTSTPLLELERSLKLRQESQSIDSGIHSKYRRHQQSRRGH